MASQRSIIVELQVPGEEFTLGRILDSLDQGHIAFETTVPTGEGSVPLFWVYNGDTDRFEASVKDHAMVEGLRRLDEFQDRTLYALDWHADTDILLTTIRAHDAHLLAASRTDTLWTLELRFPNHEALSEFQTDADANDLSLSVHRLYNPIRPDAKASYGLTDPQREALEFAVTSGHYAVPRETSTIELAEELGISDQSVSERLRRAIVTLVSNTLLSNETDQDVTSTRSR